MLLRRRRGPHRGHPTATTTLADIRRSDAINTIDKADRQAVTVRAGLSKRPVSPPDSVSSLTITPAIAPSCLTAGIVRWKAGCAEPRRRSPAAEAVEHNALELQPARAEVVVEGLVASIGRGRSPLIQLDIGGWRRSDVLRVEAAGVIDSSTTARASCAS
jgi:hypothetical protein